LSRVSISARDADRLTVKIDGVALDSTVLGTPIPLDPGAHIIEVSAPGKKAWTNAITVPPGPAITAIDVPPLGLEAVPVPPMEVRPASARESARAAQVQDAPHRDASNPERTGAWIAFGVGALGVAGGTFFGVRALSIDHDAQQGSDAATR